MLRFAVISSLLVAVLAGPVSQKNEGRVALDPNYEITWVSNADTQDITFTVVAQTTGWIGFGIGSNGMTNSDIAIGGVDDVTGEAYFGDYWTGLFPPPTLDAVQNWALVSATQDATSTTLTFQRPWVTGDTAEDNDITSGDVGVIFAWGTTDDISYHAGNRGEAILNLLG